MVSYRGKVDAMRRAGVVGALGVLAAAVLWAGDGGSSEAQRARLVALETLVAAKQAAVQAAWKELAAVDAEMARLREEGPPAPGERSAERADLLLAAAEKRSALEDRKLAILRELNSAYGELAATKDLLEDSKADLRRSQQVLDGHWLLTMMPAGLRGDLFLDQKGTLVSGEYRLENGQNGNVQGTLVNGQLVLERIDAQYGRIGRMEAVLAKDQNSLKGTWYSYEVTSGQPLMGALTVDRAAPPEESAP